ncbi:MAG: PhnD/SsuA/transferrin family substrate-binding protein, partial [Burkholderiales bacterium]|nr:PhnD/SsuA/transferrin family substrate-binding protein [Burkholderiales bacterium]
VPGKDYEVVYSGKHDNSIMGVVNRDYDAAPVASSVIDRMAARGMFKPDAVRVVWESAPFPRTAYGIAHNLPPALQEKIREAFVSFNFRSSALAKEFKDTERFGPINYLEHWRDVRVVQKETGVRYTQENLSRLGTKE